MEGKDNTTKPDNQIRIGVNSRVNRIIDYANMLLKEKSFRSIQFSAVGGAIGSLINSVEVVKLQNEGLYQVNKIGTVSYQTVDNNGNVQEQKFYPKFEVTLSLDKPAEDVGTQDKLSDDERSKLLALHAERSKRITQRRTEGYNGERGGERDFGGRSERGFSRGGRGFSRGGRGFPRGGRGFSRGGNRGFSRGGRGFSRGGNGYQPRNYEEREESYSNNRGSNRGTRGIRRPFRGNRGGF